MRKALAGILYVLAFATTLLASPQNKSNDHLRTKVNSKDELIYVWIEPETFQMGCSARDSKGSEYEKPTHSVTITKRFWIGQTPVTQTAYQKVIGFNPSRFKSGQLPVDNVTWYEALTYCQAVDMTLPTEAEWEYAARGGDTASAYGPINRIAWYRANSRGIPHAVGQKEANNYGLYDMLGNVDEWVADWYGLYDEDLVPQEVIVAPQAPGDPPAVVDKQPASAPDPNGPTKGESSVVRGASWDNDAYFVSASNRMRYDPDERHQNVGFRCAAN